MTTCAVCPTPARQRVNSLDLCAAHATDAILGTVALKWDPPAPTATAMPTRRSAVGHQVSPGKQFLQHGALPEITERPVGASPQSGRPTVRHGMWVNQFRIRVTDPRTSWRVAL